MKGNNKTIGGGGFHHVSVKARDFDASVRFYAEGLGCRETVRWGEGDGRAVILDTGDGSCVELFAGGQGKTPEGPVQHFAFNTDNCDAATERAKTAGAVITMPPKDIVVDSKPEKMSLRISFCTGPDGEVIEFFQKKAK